MAEKPVSMITPEAYLEIERQADYKSEYYRGETFAMSGASRHHVRLTSNLLFTLRKAIDDDACFVFSSELRIHIPSNGLFTYPDLGIVCGEEQYLDDRFDTLLNPQVLIEILSQSTESYDRGRKFAFYREIESLREYALVAQDRKNIEVYYRNEAGGWSLREADYRRDTVELMGHSLALDEIYRNVPIDPDPGLHDRPGR